MSEPVRFRILGPLEAVAGGRDVALGGRRSRMLVAVLVLRANESVRRDALIEAIWAEAPPGSASHALDNLVSRLRGQLGADVLQSRPGGYALVVERDRIDACRFAALARRGREALATGEPERAAALLGDALGLWRGEPLGDLADAPALRDDVRRLLDARAVAVEDRVDADLALGRHRELVPELGRLVAEEPLRERRRAQLMLALYRSGQQADALRVYREAQAYLAGELGLEPGRELRALELAVMRHDPALAPPRRAPASGSSEVASQFRRGPPRRRLLGVPAGLVGVAGVAGLLALVGAFGSHERASVSLRDGGVLLVGTGGATSVATDVGLSGVAALGGAVWASSYATGRVLRIDAVRAAVTQTVPLGQGPGAVVAAAGDLWVADAAGGRVVRVDGATGQVVQHVRVGESPVAVAAGFGSVWAASAGDQVVARLDPRSGRVTARIEVGSSPAALSAGAGGVWVAQPEARRVVRIEPRREAVDVSVLVGAGPRAVSASGDVVWVANALDATVSRVDPSLGQVVATTPVGGVPVALAADAGGVWVAVRDTEALLRLTGLDARVARRVRVGGRPVALDWIGDRVAVAISPRPSEHRGGTLRASGFGPVTSLDPAACCANAGPEVLAVLYDGLTGLDRLSSSAPSLVADLAVALPTPTGGGRVYTFTLRPGLRYSTGAPVRASDFRRAAERLMRAPNEGARAFDHLAGLEPCLHAGRCDLRDSVVTDDVAGTVSYHLTQPDPEFLYKLAGHVTAPVAPGAPATAGTAALPGTGPYRVRRFVARQIVLERNPFFREWSPTAQPAGRPDRILFSLQDRPDDAAAAVLRGDSDVLLRAPSHAVLARVRTEHPGQLHLHPAPGLFWAWLNTRAAPFDDVRVRRALNLAVDRNAAVEVFGGPGTALPTCQALPPGISGHVRYCPYTRRPNPTGRWQASDLGRARRLVAGTRNRGMLVTYWTFNMREDVGVARVTLRALRQLGYRTRLRFLRERQPPPIRLDHLQAAGAGVVLDYPVAGQLLAPFLFCRTWRPREAGETPNPSAFCDRQMIASIARAVRLETVAPDRARRHWAAADRRLVDQAAWLPLVNPISVYVTGSRVGNYTWSPAVGALLDQMWVR